jgi:hypothetical protein
MLLIIGIYFMLLYQIYVVSSQTSLLNQSAEVLVANIFLHVSYQPVLYSSLISLMYLLFFPLLSLYYSIPLLNNFIFHSLNLYIQFYYEITAKLQIFKLLLSLWLKMLTAEQ